jgi:hypothetical protein
MKLSVPGSSSLGGNHHTGLPLISLQTAPVVLVVTWEMYNSHVGKEPTALIDSIFDDFSWEELGEHVNARVNTAHMAVPECIIEKA